MRPAPERRWWCDRHRAEAPGEDLEHWTRPRVRYNAAGGIELVEQAEADAKFYEERERRSREEREKRREQNQREREAVEEVKQRWEEQTPPINVAGFWVKPGGRVVDGPEH